MYVFFYLKDSAFGSTSGLLWEEWELEWVYKPMGLENAYFWGLIPIFEYQTHQPNKDNRNESHSLILILSCQTPPQFKMVYILWLEIVDLCKRFVYFCHKITFKQYVTY